MTHTLPFWVAGATLGLAFGAATMWVQVSHCCWRGRPFTRASAACA